MNKRFYNFGGFRLDTHNQRLLRSGGETITLTLKQFELLLALVENAGDVVSKDELFEQVWKGVAIADETLTRHVSFLRQKLGDGEFIETVPKRGYRFAVPVTTSDAPEILIEEKTLTRIRVEETIKLSEPSAVADGSNVSKQSLLLSENPPATADGSDKTRLAVAFALLAVISIGFIIYQNYFDQPGSKINFAANIKPLSGAPGRENSPAFSPDSKQIAFSWNGGEREKSDIYVQIIGAGEPVRLTDTEFHEHYPTFAPDGKHIAFVRDLKTHGEIILIPALGGAERRIARVFSGNYSISFAPEGGNSIAVVDAADEANKKHAIYTIDLKTGARRRLTAAGEFFGETTPRFSPDGKSLAFVRVFPDYTQDLFVVSTVGENNEPLRLTEDLKAIHSLAWSAGGKEVFFVSLRQSSRPNLWRVGASGGAPNILTTGGKDMTNLAASPDGKFIAYVENTLHSDIFRQFVGETAAQPLLMTSHIEDVPDFSPDGRHIVFRSSRSGSSEAWMSDADGKNLRQITDCKRQVGNARFSPDGTQIVFHAADVENKDIFISSVEGGEARPLTGDDASDFLPEWSADGRFVYFASERTGAKQIWRVPADGGEAVQITRSGGLESAASPDGKWIYYIKESFDGGLWRVSANATAANSDEAQVSQLVNEGFQNVWTHTQNGIYFIARAEKPPAKIKFFDFSTEQVSEIAESEKFVFSKHAGMTVSPDGKIILLAQFDQNASNIMLAEIE